MQRPLLIVRQSDSLIQIADIHSHSKWQTVQVQISWPLQKPTDLNLHCLQRQGIFGSAGQVNNHNGGTIKVILKSSNPSSFLFAFDFD